MFTNRGELLSQSEFKEYKPTGPIYTGSCLAGTEIAFSEEEHTLVTRLTRDKQCFAVGLSNGAIKMYTYAGDKIKMVYSLPVTDKSTLSCTDLQFVPYKDFMPSEKKHMLVAVYASGHVKLWHYTASSTKARLSATFMEERIARPSEPYQNGSYIKDGKLFQPPIRYNEIMCCSVSQDGARFATAGEDGCIRVYDIFERQQIGKCYSTYSSEKMDGHVMKVCAIQYHPRGESEMFYSHIFVSGGWDDTVQIWDDRFSHSLWQYYGPHICGTDALDIDPFQNHILTASWRRDKTILEIWKFNEDAVREFNETQQITRNAAEYKQYAQPITKSLQDKNSPSMGYVSRWLGESFIIFGGGNHNILKIIDRSTFNPLGQVAELPNAVYSVAFNLPEVVTEKRPIRIAFCSGTKLYMLKLERA